MLPRSAVIYSPTRRIELTVEGMSLPLCNYVAQCAGFQVVRTVVERDQRTNSALRALLEELWKPDVEDEIIFPYTLIIPNKRMATKNLRNAILAQVLGVVVADDVWGMLDNPAEYDFPVCPHAAPSQLVMTFTINGQEAVCPHIHDGSDEWEGVLPSCRFKDGDDPICPHRPGFEVRYAEYRDHVARLQRINYRRLNLHFFETRAQFAHRVKAERPEVMEYNLLVFSKMCQILERERRHLSNSEIARLLSDGKGPDNDGIRYYTSLDGTTPFDDYTISKLLAKLGVQKEWRDKVRAYGPRPYSRLHMEQ